MNDIFDLSLYKKFNTDLKVDLDNGQLVDHYNEIGKYQMRIYFPLSLFKKNKIYIFSTKFGYYMENILRYILFKNFYISEIIYEIDYNNPNLHIIPFCQKINKFPKNYIIYQLEQKDISKWIDQKYELSILFSKKTLDYSQSNIDKFPDIIKRKMIYYPIPLIPYHYLNYNANINNNPSNNILFYGSMNNIRRLKLNYLQNRLSPNYKIKIINDLFGEKLFNEIMNSKIILNIHFYKDAILETYRINEVLSCGKIVISEYPNKIDIVNYHSYKDKVIFIENMDDMYDKIIENLSKEFSNKFYNIFNSKEIIEIIEENDIKEI